MAKTIITYLVDWSPTWIKTIELFWRIGKAISFPRAKIKELKERKEIQNPWIYFLFWEDENGNNLAYIWEAENIFNRLLNHDTNKDFWNFWIIFISTANNITKADVKYLESKSIIKAKNSNRYKLLNTVEPIPNNLPEYQVSSMEEFLSNIELIINSIGYPILTEIKSSEKNNQKRYFIKNKWILAEGVYTEEWFIIKKWSQSIKETTKSFWWKVQKTREEILKSWIMKDNWPFFVFEKDFLTSSPSHASSIILWSMSNWRIIRKDENDNTLDENERSWNSSSD